VSEGEREKERKIEHERREKANDGGNKGKSDRVSNLYKNRDPFIAVEFEWLANRKLMQSHTLNMRDFCYKLTNLELILKNVVNHIT
jgi:hypothetical protein